MKSLLFVSLLLLLCEFNAGKVRQHIPVKVKKNWSDAQKHCRKYYTDLSTITSVSENNLIKSESYKNGQSFWIGLHRMETNLNIWEWSDQETSSYFDLYNSGDTSKQCVVLDWFYGWYDAKCQEKRYFFCERILAVVGENKTWEGAYNHCRDHYSGLANLASDTELQMAKTGISGTQIVSVWTSLRFLDGEWIWVNSDSLESLDSLPFCPAQPYRCGARNLLTDLWENRDCEEKLSFCCY